MHVLHFKRPATAAYPPPTILMVQMHQRTELQVDLSVGHWKQALQSRGLYLPENPPGRDGHESNIRRLRGAMKNHTDVWRHRRPQDNIHWDKHHEFETMQNIYRIPSMYADPNTWLEGHRATTDYCQHHRCVSVWWYYDQLVRDTPGFVLDFRHAGRPESNRRSDSKDHTQPRQSTWTPMQLNLADEAEVQRPRLINRTHPEPHEDMLDTEEWSSFYDDKMPDDMKRMLKDLQYEMKRIKGGNESTTKDYRDTRAGIIEIAAAAYERDRNSPQIPYYLLAVAPPWTTYDGHARMAYDQHKLFELNQRIDKLRTLNASTCQMQISSQRQNGPAGRRGL